MKENSNISKITNVIKTVFKTVLGKVVSCVSTCRSTLHRFQQSSVLAPWFEGALFFFAATGALFVFVFLAMQFGLFNVKGSIAERNAFFTATTTSSVVRDEAVKNLIKEIDSGISDARARIFPNTDFSWVKSAEWNTLKGALIKDRAVIERAAHDAGVEPRVLVSVVIAEQLRFFTADRESFKAFFEPLKILGTLSQFSLGVSGIKPETARLIESHLTDTTSPYYVEDSTGAFQKLLAPTQKEAETVKSTSTDALILERLTNSQDHYYSYLYTALFVRQVSTQWQKAGIDISNRPEILATLFNLGFEKSEPKPNPQVAGSVIEIGGKKYTFGELAFGFYYSGELATVFGF